MTAMAVLSTLTYASNDPTCTDVAYKCNSFLQADFTSVSPFPLVDSNPLTYQPKVLIRQLSTSCIKIDIMRFV